MDNNSKENCPVCFGKANPKKPFHCHYGAICCLKCRSFFRRVVQSNGTANLEKVFYCVNSKLNRRCDMREFGTRHKCSYCRLQRCLNIGLNPAKVVLDEETRRKFTGKIYNLLEYECISGFSNVPFALGFKKRKDFSPNENLAPSVDMALRNDSEESSLQVKDEPLENYDDQMMLALTNSVSLDFTEAVAETSVPPDLLKILKHFFYTETSLMKEDIYSKISKNFESFCFK